MASSTSPVVLILGAGRNIGKHTAQLFTTKGYKVAVAARSINENDSTSTQLYLQCDLSDPNAVQDVFSRVKATLGDPSVVVYNAYALTQTDADDIFSLSTTQFSHDLNVNTTSAFAAAQQAVKTFERLPTSAARTFLYTGNALNGFAVPLFFTLGVGKSASAHMIESASLAYREKGFKFYYVDERKPDGSSDPAVDGEAHAKLFAELVEREDQGPWLQTFVKGEGYRVFPVRA
ncbi:putative short-chain dehydrogenase [Aspergillus homomorphus CBS 101889]|uniref:Putative short-chain dehydrogenase n=1 Tax=Aspergillus homomorphus (strain CBS 101889) TaxID=1450537 RepID=A0A395I434_ASPHC|nr:putative short-chain dehydrogenase [Aspergillus homomorphus CBS 101889]RAL14496.1 putative short-chain dehydrogenase [Aspergillus homomorphus CBS 101889]